LMLPVFCLYVAIVVYDLRHKIIPDAFVYTAIILAFVFSLIMSESLISDLVAGIVLFGFFAGLWLLTSGRAIGFGDAKLVLSIGLMLGAANGISAIILAFWIGAVYGIGSMIFSLKKITMKTEIPFAPFLILGAWLAVYYNFDLLHVSLF
jgi:prepilin signal peptidase PulO-like enzyme (type II secretory pathway)